MKIEIENKVIDYYNNQKISSNKIAKLLNINVKTVFAILKRNNIKVRTLSEAMLKYSCNDYYFNNIDTEEKAYWLGVLFADGNITRKNSNTGEVIFSSKDRNWIEMFINSINSNTIIYTEFHKKFKKYIYKVKITSKQMFDDLNNLGCTENKTKILVFPKLPIELNSHFIRGFFDGDGTVGVYKNTSKTNWKILRSGFCCASEDFITILQSKLPVKYKNIFKRNENMFILQYSQFDSISLYNYLYTNATIYLNRKKDIFDSFIHNYKPSKRFNDYNRPSQVDEGIV